ncbi:UDP-N-acetylmuramoyl-L-alanine--D-glutamate ligase [Bacteroidota bacterium]
MKSYDIVILGSGESGTGAAVLAKEKGLRPFVSDFGSIKDSYKEVLSHHDIKFEEGKHSESIILETNEIVKSPGIPDTIPLLKKAKEKDISVISEIEFAYRYSDGKMICITGSNGKTTTTLLIHHILKNAGFDACLAGNIGESFAMELAKKDHDYFVLEISSFQLDGMFDFKADIAVLMNITPDHLDRYDYDFEKYADSKFRISRNQGPNDNFIYCFDDETIKRRFKKENINAKQFPFSIKEDIKGDGAFIKENKIVININSKPIYMTLESLALQGKHNIYNSMAAGIATRILDVSKDRIKQSLTDFENVAHRLEFVANIQGIEYINDSKATNVNSSWYALESMNHPVIWIVGGVDKGNDYTMLMELVRDKVKAIVCLGKETSKITDAFAGVVETIVSASSMEEAVRYTFYLGQKDDIVLLSPACASFDQYENYIERGDTFKKEVKKL